MRNIEYPKRFAKKLDKFVTLHPEFKKKIIRIVDMLRKDPFAPSLVTHKLSGKLSPLFACSISLEYRLIFDITDETIYLVNIGTHDEVY